MMASGEQSAVRREVGPLGTGAGLKIPPARFPGLLWLLGFSGVVLVHFIWLSMNSAPAVWDMAHHQIMGWEHLRALQNGGQTISRISDYYPPLYYLAEALVLFLLGPTPYLAILVNLPGLVLLSYFTKRLGELVMGPTAAALAGVMVLLLPLVAWTSRETLLDITLAGWSSALFFLIWRSDFLQERRYSPLLGLVLAAGIMTKWTFLLFAAPAIAFSLWRSRSRRAVLNLLDTAILALPLTAWWYFPNIVPLLERFRMTSAAAVWEQDPGFWSPLGAVYYLRSLSSYYLFLPLSMLFAWGSFWLLRRELGSVAGRYLITLFLGSTMLLTVLGAKDPRYCMPLVPLVSIVLIYGISRAAALQTALLTFAVLQFLSVSFSFTASPVRWSLFQVRGDQDYASMSQEWVLYQSDYFGVAGPPRQEDWRHGEIVRLVRELDRVGFVPDAARFHPGALTLEAIQQGKRISVVRLGSDDQWLRSLSECDWVVGKTGGQGISYITQFSEDLYEFLETHRWQLVREWLLPDRSKARLWRNPTRSPS